MSADLNLNYRLIELGFITSTRDLNYIKNNLDSFTKRIAEAINGRQIDAPSSKPSADKITWNWKGVFYPNPEKAIRVRKTAGLTGTIVEEDSWLYTKDDWVKFDQVIKKDGYWWIRFKYQREGSSTNDFYCAVCRITDKEQKIKNEKYWGTIEWA